MNFNEAIRDQWRQQKHVCIGLDPFPEYLPNGITDLFEFNKAIIDATADLACCYKPQFAHYAALGKEHKLKETIHYIKKHYPSVPVILDSKRGDIGSTATMYAKEAFEQYAADAVTVNPYMGSDTVLPFSEFKDKGVIVLCRTSNPSASEFQNQSIEGEPLYIHVARKAQQDWNSNNNISLVVGATAPQEMKHIRSAAPKLPFLIPGIGAQGGDLKSTLINGRFSDGDGVMINSSRGIIYASKEKDFADAARRETEQLQLAINQNI
ncbi:orotidine-5'-phosphate decarboxylase [Reinekea thalattae]|uniref:Orotidine 5'-phosphate decarboxylase n=1 Tax=Reinekea thalattae TaxID=2593301 RepID=A0A5C8Z335_9GAMM|nr:orotidine-5'-phosphate decarboxylase [Reinekea thalattae]TXR51967.1 orotidine-5'-phosphate decarboxylase [Reinekea thalattae]